MCSVLVRLGSLQFESVCRDTTESGARHVGKSFLLIMFILLPHFANCSMLAGKVYFGFLPYLTLALACVTFPTTNT